MNQNANNHKTTKICNPQKFLVLQYYVYIRKYREDKSIKAESDNFHNLLN